MMTRTWYLVRHGETEWNSEGRMQGRLDSRLSARGREQAARTGEVLGRLGVDHLFASPLGRVRETLELFAPHVTLVPVFDDRLMEWSAGDWSGRLYREIRQECPDDYAAWQADLYNVRSPGGENFADLAARAAAFFDEAQRLAHERIAIVGHGFMNRALAGRLLGLSAEDMLAIGQDNDTIFRVVMNNGSTIADHYAAGEGPFPGLTTDRPRHKRVTQTP
jgi:broad specificity phosphatase PhoE